jgi:hypothetical protein
MAAAGHGHGSQIGHGKRSSDTGTGAAGLRPAAHRPHTTANLIGTVRSTIPPFVLYLRRMSSCRTRRLGSDPDHLSGATI